MTWTQNMRLLKHLPGRVIFMFRLVFKTTADPHERWFDVFPIQFGLRSSQRLVNDETVHVIDVRLVGLAIGYERLGYLNVFFTFIEGFAKMHGFDGVYVDHVTEYKLREHLFERKYSKDKYFQLSMFKRMK